MQKKLTSLSQYKYFSLIILGGDLGIVDTWHATINFKIMVHAPKKLLQKFTQQPNPVYIQGFDQNNMQGLIKTNLTTLLGEWHFHRPLSYLIFYCVLYKHAKLLLLVRFLCVVPNLRYCPPYQENR